MFSEGTLVKFNSSTLPQNFVSLATKVSNKKTPKHAAILIRHQSINYLHHFPGDTRPEIVDDFNEDGWYIYKFFSGIKVDDENEVGSFLQFCKRVCNTSNIAYSFVLDNSSYDNDGNFISASGLPELATCVGFCLNTLSNTIIDGESYFNLDEWDATGIDEEFDDWAVGQAQEKYPHLDWTLYNAYKKRVNPLEYLCSAYFDEYPIPKEKITNIRDNVQREILELFV